MVVVREAGSGCGERLVVVVVVGEAIAIGGGGGGWDG